MFLCAVFLNVCVNLNNVYVCSTNICYKLLKVQLKHIKYQENSD